MSKLSKTNPHSNKEPSCPFWEASKCGSKAGSDGIYIPLDDHVRLYCESSNYPLCSQYLECDEQGDDQVSNKRKRARINSKQPITIVYLNESGNVVSKEIQKTTTIDFSMGGMRLVTDEPIMKNSLIQFSLEDSKTSQHQKGIAISRWCNQLHDEDGYQVGFAYHNKETTLCMGHFFNSTIKRGNIRA